MGQFDAAALANGERAPLSIAEVPLPELSATGLRTELGKGRIGTIFEPIGSIRDPQQLPRLPKDIDDLHTGLRRVAGPAQRSVLLGLAIA